MKHIHTASIVALLITWGAGCNDSLSPAPSVPSTAPISPVERQQILDALAEAQREAENTEPPKPNITLATPPGWTRSETRALPPSDNGFTVGYQHDSGLTVTLYQFTRGIANISSDTDSPVLREEMLHAKSGIEQAVQLGYWQSAKEHDSGVVELGDSCHF